jgi:hypothetical protein
MSQLEVNKVIPQSGTTLTLGESGDTVSIPSGATFTPTLTAPIIDEINDNNGNEEIIFTTTTSAVNELTIANAATGNAPEIAATGDDTDIDLKLTPKGAGNLVLDGIEFPNADGSANQVLQTNGSGVLSFATPSGGKVLQVVSAFTTTEATSSSSTYADSNLTATITPSSASNKVLVLISQSGSKAGANTYLNIRVYRGATEIGGTVAGRSIGYTNDGAANYVGIAFSCSILDTPSSTSALTYKTQFNNNNASGTVRINVDSGASYITLMEIAG